MHTCGLRKLILNFYKDDSPSLTIGTIAIVSPSSILIYSASLEICYKLNFVNFLLKILCQIDINCMKIKLDCNFKGKGGNLAHMICDLVISIICQNIPWLK